MLKVDHDAAGLVAGQANWLKDYRPSMRIREQGKVISIGDGIAWISGLPTAAIDDILDFEDGSQAMVFDLTENQVGAVLLHQTDQLTSGITVYPTGKLLSVPVSDHLLGRVIDPQGRPLDEQPLPDNLPRRH
ncbi:MAG: F0F1 ATP synthase subunit alpha, partial [Gammaproteobacteria bacterium]|nr:F0F1 ATP synthase subunit alpha [Gammaproteobacteria bacterium]